MSDETLYVDIYSPIQVWKRDDHIPGYSLISKAYDDKDKVLQSAQADQYFQPLDEWEAERDRAVRRATLEEVRALAYEYEGGDIVQASDIDALIAALDEGGDRE